MRADPAQLRGSVFDPVQTVHLATMLGINVRPLEEAENP